jgi:tetratricopeptide (TPR) repeat protein
MNLLIFKKVLFAGITIASLIVHADYSKYKTYLNRARKYYKEKNYKNATAFFLKAEKQSYDENSLACAMVNRGNCLVLLKEYKLAEKIFQTVISNPKTPSGYKSGAMKSLGLCLIRQNNYEAAEKVLNDCLKTDKLSNRTKEEALWLLGQCYYDKGNFDNAEKLYKQMLTIKILSPGLKKKVMKKIKEIEEFK